MALVADYSAGKPGARVLKAAGFTGAVRYCGFSDPGDSRTPKCTTKAELDDFTANNMGMALVFESRADDWRGGYQAGAANYRIARAHADRIGFPKSRPIYMAVDSEVVGDANHRLMADYLRGARDAAGGPHLVGVYGQYSVCAWVYGGGIVNWYWQCRAWSGTPIRWFDPRHLFQRVGTVLAGPVPCDINDVSQDDWGQHNVEVDELSWNDELTDESGFKAKAGEWLTYTNNKVDKVTDDVQALRNELQELRDALTVPTIDYDRLAKALKVPTAEENAEAVNRKLKEAGN